MSENSPEALRLSLPLTRRASLLIGAGMMAAGCSSTVDMFGGPTQQASPQTPAQPGNTLGGGQVRIGLILPLTATGNAGVVAGAMRNAAELALSEFNNPDIQLLVKDDGGTAPGAGAAAQQAIDEGAEIILGPLFSHSVAAAGQTARQRNVPVIAFSTDTNVASKGIYLLSFLPESDVDRIIEFAVSQGKRSFAALLPENAYGTVVEGAFTEAVNRKGARVAGIGRYPLDKLKLQEPVKSFAPTLAQADALFLPDASDSAPLVLQALMGSGANLRQIQLLGTGLWDDPRIFQNSAFNGALFPAPDSAGYRNYAGRYRAKFGSDPVRNSTLAYDAVSLVAALVKTQGAQRFQENILTNSGGFSGIDGVFRFRPNGPCERGLAVLKVGGGSAQVISPAPRTFQS